MESGVTVWGRRLTEAGEVEDYPVAFFSVHQCGSLEACEELAEAEANWLPMGARERAIYEAGLARISERMARIVDGRIVVPALEAEADVEAEEDDVIEVEDEEFDYPELTKEEIEEAQEFLSRRNRADRLHGTIVTDRGPRNVDIGSG